MLNEFGITPRNWQDASGGFDMLGQSVEKYVKPTVIGAAGLALAACAPVLAAEQCTVIDGTQYAPTTITKDISAYPELLKKCPQDGLGVAITNGKITQTFCAAGMTPYADGAKSNASFSANGVTVSLFDSSRPPGQPVYAGGTEVCATTP